VGAIKRRSLRQALEIGGETGLSKVALVNHLNDFILTGVVKKTNQVQAIRYSVAGVLGMVQLIDLDVAWKIDLNVQK